MIGLFDLDTWQEIVETVRGNKLRTFLTACGVFWGMFMLLVMLGFGEGLQRGVNRGMGDFATNSVFIWGQRTSMPYKGFQAGRNVGYDNADTEAIASEIKGIRALAPRNQLGGYQDGNNVSRGTKTGNFSVMGDYPQYRMIEPIIIEQGRFLNPLDLGEQRKVAAIGAQVYAELFAEGEDPIGQSLNVQGVWFQVIGVFRSTKGGEQAADAESKIHIPFTTFQQAFNYGDRVSWFAINGEDDVSASVLEEEIRALLASRHNIHPDDGRAIGSFNAEEQFGKMKNLFAGIQVFVWIVGTITLLAGVIGVSNIMLIVVRERTREIGLRRAIGATPGSVIALIIQEAVALTTLAGAAGLVFGVAVLEITASVVGSDNEVLGNPQVDIGVALAAVAVLTIGGALAGVVPARHAARIHPVEALRAE